MNNKPATPLPFKVGAQVLAPRITRIMATGKCVASSYHDQDAAYIAHAANAYPRLVAALRLKTKRLFTEAMAEQLLRELGEDA